MTLKIIDPVEITASTQVTTNLTAPSLWSISTPYTTGDVVERSSKKWQAIQDSTGEKPTAGGLAGTEFWQWIGPTPLEAAFDNGIGIDVPKPLETVAIRLALIEYTILVTEDVDSVALFGLVADELEFEYLEDEFNTPGSEGTGPTGAIAISEDSYVNYSFDLPAGSHLKISIRMSGGGGTDLAKVGSIIWGNVVEFSTASVEALSVRKVKRSVTEDNGYVMTLTPRLPTKAVRARYSDSKTSADSLSALFRKLDSTATVYDHGSDETEFLVYGFNEDSELTRIAPDLSEFSFQIQGLN